MNELGIKVDGRKNKLKTPSEFRGRGLGLDAVRQWLLSRAATGALPGFPDFQKTYRVGVGLSAYRGNKFAFPMIPAYLEQYSHNKDHVNSLIKEAEEYATALKIVRKSLNQPGVGEKVKNSALNHMFPNSVERTSTTVAYGYQKKGRKGQASWAKRIREEDGSCIFAEEDCAATECAHLNFRGAPVLSTQGVVLRKDFAFALDNGHLDLLQPAFGGTKIILNLPGNPRHGQIARLSETKALAVSKELSDLRGIKILEKGLDTESILC